MRLLWISDSPTTPSGFGMVTREVCGRLADRGYRVEILGWQQHGRSERWHEIPVHPVRHDMFGADTVLGYLIRQRPDFVITLADVWWMSFLADPPVQRFLDQSGARWVLYYPIDGADPSGGLPPSWKRMLETADVPVAMSRFGAEVSAACGVDAAYVPHGVDLDVFSPPADKAAAKARLGYEGRFVVLSDARNQPRKLLPRTLEIFERFARGKDDVVLHLHADPNDDAARSELYHYNLREDLAALDLAGRVRLTDSFVMRGGCGLSTIELAALYQAADIHLLASWGEGFGLPNLQAASTGVVPVAVDYTASRELVEGHGFAIPTESTVVDEFGLVRCLLDRDAAADALERLYRDGRLLADRSRRCREFAESYSWDGVVDAWEDVFRSAAPRRRPSASRTLEWTAGAEPPLSDLPAPTVHAAAGAFAPLPDGTRLSLTISERSYGEVAGAIRRDAFREGDELSIPVRLPPWFEGAPRARVGKVMVGAADLPLAGALKRIFPGLAYMLPQRNANPSEPEPLPTEELLPVVAQCALVLDYGQRAPIGIDAACAALGITYAGRSPYFPPDDERDPLRAVRRLLTDQGYAARRREYAAGKVEAVYGAELVGRMRSFVQAYFAATAGETVAA
jgi:glycosyltransferase involved in cell wall biosynthesis